MEIKVLGTGCATCQKTYEFVKKTIEKKNILAKITKVQDIPEIMKYGIMQAPGIVINEKVKVSGRIPDEDELLKWIEEES